MITVDLLEPKPNDIEASIKMLQEKVFPLYARGWNTCISKPEFNPPIQHFVNFWFSGSMKIFCASRDGQPVGILVGTIYRPMQYDASVFGIMDCFIMNNSSEVLHALQEQVLQAVKILGCNEIWFDRRYATQPWIFPAGWKKSHEVVTDVYVKE